MKKAIAMKCDTFTITKETVIKYDMKDEFPEVFKKELECGKWYKHEEGGCLVFVEELQKNDFKGYGFSFGNKWQESQDNWTYGFTNWQEATPQEVEAALICESKKRGYKRGVTVLRTQEMLNEFETPNTRCSVEIECETFDYREDYNSLTIDGRVIFINGIWATIIQPEKMTLSQIEKELGRKIELI